MKLKLFTSILSLSICLFATAQTDTLYVYGPGGPQAAIEECAKIFSKKIERRFLCLRPVGIIMI